MNSDLSRGSKELKDLCVLVYTETASTGHEALSHLREVLAFSQTQCVEYLNKAVRQLICTPSTNDPRSWDSGPNYELALQKLEQEVRGHIKVEHQLKIMVDSCREKLEATEQKYYALKTSSATEIADLKEKNRRLCELLKTIEDEPTAATKSRPSRTHCKSIRHASRTHRDSHRGDSSSRTNKENLMTSDLTKKPSESGRKSSRTPIPARSKSPMLCNSQSARAIN
jgi:hypothetical protein